MKEIKVVIGKNFGDEGKGQTVSDLCKGQSALVIRHNGGAQAGHTVEEGKFRFVFHQLGSGSLWGAPTYLTHTFLPDLLKIEEEMEAVDKAFIYASPDCACTVIYDVILNSLTEVLRDENRHGSCGMGIYEATLRSREERYCLRLKTIADAWKKGRTEAVKEIADTLDRIRQEYTKPKMELLKKEYPDKWNTPQTEYWESMVDSEDLLWNAAEDMCMNFKKYFILVSPLDLIKRYDRIVFENAQGLMLDEENEEYYPHLTPSHTGLYNVVKFLAELSELTGDYNLEVIYVTRTYVTRHGAGKLEYECTKDEISPKIEDLTNIPNVWQNNLRFAFHPAGEEFFRYVLKDLKELDLLKTTAPKSSGSLCVEKSLETTVTLRMNHLDETDNKVFFSNGEMGMDEFEQICKNKGFRVWKCEKKRG